MQHPVEALFERLPQVEPYPPGVLPVPERLPGTAFFPGGTGLWRPEGSPDGDPPPMPLGGVMVLGHDFYSEAGYRRFLANRGGSTKGPTWRNLLALLARVGVAPEGCFFTNAYMGLRAGPRNTGRFPGASDRGFVDRCRGFLLEQLAAQRPRLLLTLGSHVPAFVAPLSPDLGAWAGAKSLSGLDAAGVPVIARAAFDGLPGLTSSVVALTHPSLRPASVWRRRYGGLAGDAAEVAMLEAALRASPPASAP